MICLLASVSFGCSGSPAARRPLPWLGTPIELGEAEPGRETRQIVLITIDGVRWQEVFHGADPTLLAEAGLAESSALSASELLPNLYRHFFEGGVVIGAPSERSRIHASGPSYLSLPGYLEILRGRTISDCQDNECPSLRAPTLLDELRERPETIRSDIAVFTSWQECSRAASNDPSQIVLSTGRLRGSIRDLAWVHPRCDELFARGRAMTPEPGTGAYRPDRGTGPVALCYLATARPTMLWIGLGDTDEHAHAGDYLSYLRALQRADAFVGRVIEQLSAMGEYGRTTTVIVTTDHGRGPNFSDHGGHASASRVFLLLTGGRVPRRGILEADRIHRLADIAPTIRSLLDGRREARGDLTAR